MSFPLTNKDKIIDGFYYPAVYKTVASEASKESEKKSKTLIWIEYTMEPLLRGHPDEIPSPLERPLDNVNLNKDVLIFTPDVRPFLLKGHFSDAKGVASQER